MLQNIYQNSTRQLTTKLYTGHYYDFMIHRGGALNSINLKDLLITDFKCPFNFKDNGRIESTTQWKNSVNNGAELNDIGFTGVDNGFITYDKTKITNKEFLEIFTNSKYVIPPSDFNFFMSPISGNTGRFEFPISYIESDNECYLSFKGGFYQGFYKLEEFDYEVLPNDILSNRIIHFELRPRSDYEVKENTINALHPENKGIFFYMGVRAENKMAVFYNEGKNNLDQFIKDPNHKDIENPKNKPYVADELDPHDYFKDEYNSPMDCSTGDENPDEPADNPLGCKCKEKYSNSVNNFYSDTTTWINDCCSCEKPEPDECGNYFKDGYTNDYAQNGDEIFNIGTDDKNTTNNSNNHKSESINKDEYSYNTGTCEAKLPIIKDCSCKEKDKSETTTSDSHICNIYEDGTTWINNCKGGCNCSSGDCECKTIDCNNFFGDDYMLNSGCGKGNASLDDDYMSKDIKLDEDELKKTLSDSEGHIISKKGYFDIKTDNKFLMFDRTPNGVTTKTYQEGMEVILEGRNDVDVNLFEIMNRTSTGYTTNTIEEYYETHTKPYDIYKDIKNNTFALRITDDGAIGYRYGVLDCNNENHYSIIEEYSKDGIVKFDEWNTINVRFVMLTPKTSKCNKKKRKMKLMIYVNGFLKLVSKDLDSFNFHGIDDCKEKQEGVPYSLSLGGGTLGLLEMITPDYYKVSNYLFPIEKDFCGSFIGDIKRFSIYEGFTDYSSILNYLS